MPKHGSWCYDGPFITDALPGSSGSLAAPALLGEVGLGGNCAQLPHFLFQKGAPPDPNEQGPPKPRAQRKSQALTPSPGLSDGRRWGMHLLNAYFKWSNPPFLAMDPFLSIQPDERGSQSGVILPREDTWQ